MSISVETLKEIEMLALFNDDTFNEGIKVHKTADQDNIEAVKRLFDKGLVSQSDGGYLTTLGTDAVQHAHGLLSILCEKPYKP